MQKAEQNRREVIAIGVSGLLTGLAFLLSPLVARGIAPILCPLLGNQCSLDEKGPLILAIIDLLLLFGTAVFSLKFIVKLRWLTSIEASLAVVAFIFAVIMILGALEAPPSTLKISGSFLIAAVIGSVMGHAYAFKSLKRGQWRIGLIACLAVVTFYVALPYIFASSLKDYHQSLVNQEEAKEAKNLPFTIYAPTNVSTKFSLIDANAHLATADMPANYDITYSNQPLTYTRGAKSFYIDERIFPDYKPPETCSPYKRTSLDTQPLGTCQKIGTLPQCEVYYQYPADMGQRMAYCKIDQTLITLTADEDVLTTNEMVELFRSFKTSDAKQLQEEALKHR